MTLYNTRQTTTSLRLQPWPWTLEHIWAPPAPNVKKLRDKWRGRLGASWAHQPRLVGCGLSESHSSVDYAVNCSTSLHLNSFKLKSYTFSKRFLGFHGVLMLHCCTDCKVGPGGFSSPRNIWINDRWVSCLILVRVKYWLKGSCPQRQTWSFFLWQSLADATCRVRNIVLK